MKMLTLSQPWASLVVWGEKRYETRSWMTQYRGRLGIHAAKTLTADAAACCRSPLFQAVLAEHGITDPQYLPFGRVLGSVMLEDIDQITPLLRDHVLSRQEVTFGNYTPGRYAWRLREPVEFGDQVEARGSLGLWTWDG